MEKLKGVNYITSIQTIGNVKSAIRFLIALQGQETFYIKKCILTKLNSEDRVKREFTNEVKNRILLDYQKGNFSEGQVITVPFFSKNGYKLIDNIYIKKAFEEMRQTEKRAKKATELYKRLENKMLDKTEVLQSIEQLNNLY